MENQCQAKTLLDSWTTQLRKIHKICPSLALKLQSNSYRSWTRRLLCNRQRNWNHNHGPIFKKEFLLCTMDRRTLRRNKNAQSQVRSTDLARIASNNNPQQLQTRWRLRRPHGHRHPRSQIRWVGAEMIDLNRKKNLIVIIIFCVFVLMRKSFKRYGKKSKKSYKRKRYNRRGKKGSLKKYMKKLIRKTVNAEVKYVDFPSV